MRQHYWTADEDEILNDMRARGKSAAQIARVLPGRTRNAVISRMNRDRIFPCEERFKRLSEALRERRIMERAAKDAAIFAVFRSAVEAGLSRDEALLAARNVGAPLRMIAKHVGISFQRVQRIYALSTWANRRIEQSVGSWDDPPQ